MRFLIAEDNAQLAHWLSQLLRRDHYVIDLVKDGEAADAALSTHSYDFVLLDLSLPGRDGLEVLRRFRQRNKTTPVIILTARASVDDLVTGLDAGADDYLAKPFKITELEARIRAQLRRASNNKAAILEFGKLRFEPKSRAFTLDGAVMNLTPREHAVLETLIRAGERTTPKTALFDSIFGFDDSANPNAVEIYIHRLRKKLEGSNTAILTLRGVGYRLHEG